MNSCATWTSKGLPTRTSRPPTSPIPWAGTSSQVSLRSVQKTCGLFNTEGASNPVVASQAVKPGTETGAMENFVAMATEEGSLGGIFQDLPMDLTEADYLDSFMDLSNFLIPEESERVTENVKAEGEDMKEKVLDFSGRIPSLDSTLPVYTVQGISPATDPSPRKRKHAETSVDIIDTAAAVSDLEFCEAQVNDHDYVSKKMRMDVEPKPGTSKVQVERRSKSKDKYRERRDKNNAASKRSREIKKQKYIEMDKEADTLEIKNEALRKKIVELEELAKFMKAELIRKMTSK